MQNKLTDLRFSYINTRRIQNKVSKSIHELVGPDRELEKSSGELENILRWEDDGGLIVGVNVFTDDLPPISPIPANRA